MALERDERGWLVVHTCPQYALFLEQAEGRWWIHIDVHQWNHKVAQELARAQEKLCDALGSLWGLEQNPKQARFMRLVGWEPQGFELDEYDVRRRVYRKEKQR